MADLLHPDAELLKLAAERNHLVELRNPIREEANRLSALAEEQWKSEGNGASRDDPAAWEAYMELCGRVGLIDAEDARDAIDDQIFPLDHKIRAIPAQTVAGLKVKFDLLRDYMPTSYVDEGPRDEQDFDVCLLNELADDLQRLASTAHPDAKLIELGEEYRTTRRAEIALYQEIGDDESPETMARVDKLGFEMGRLSRAILATQPKTVDGLRVIARVWGAHHINMDGSWPHEPAHTDTQAVHAVMRWLVEGGASCD